MILRDVIIFADRVDGNWWKREGHILSVDDLMGIVEAKPEALVVGTGYSGLIKVPPETKMYLKFSGIELIAAKTEEVCKIYNELSKLRRVVAALHVTC